MIAMTHSLASWIEKNHVSLFLFDLDDTLIETNTLFITQLTRCQEIITAADKSLTASEVLETVFSLNTSSYTKMFGDFDRRWPFVVQELVRIFHLEEAEISHQLLSTLQKTQTELPQLKPFAKETLEQLRTVGVKTGVVTQAEESWTSFKMQGLELSPFFDAVFPVGSKHPKTAAVWGEAITHFETTPLSTVVVGDSLSNDMMSAKEAGVKHLFWIQDGKNWSHSLEGDVPAGVTEIAGVADLLQLV